MLVTAAGGDFSKRSAEVARALKERADVQISVLHVADDETAGREFLEERVVEFLPSRWVAPIPRRFGRYRYRGSI